MLCVLFTNIYSQETMTEPGFIKGKSDNLPMVDIITVGEFLSTNDNFVSAEVRGVKNVRLVSC